MCAYGRNINSSDRRQEPREPADQPVSLCRLPDIKQTVIGRLIDISHSGIGLTAAEPMPPGAWISVAWDETVMLGHSVHCAAANDAYRVGMRTDYIISDRTGRHRGKMDDLIRSLPSEYFRF